MPVAAPGRASDGEGSDSDAPLPVLADVVRSGVVESRHRGSLVVTAPDGTVLLRRGRPDEPVFPRSSVKPLQAVGMLRAGLDADGEALALVAASHSGQPRHVALARRLLAAHGLDDSVLRCPPSLPLDEAAAAELVRDGGGPDRIHMNCSGKHSGMLVTCAATGWPLEGYLDPAHPLQRAVRAAVEDLAGEAVAHVAVDGCGAPLFALSLTGLARALGRLVQASPGTAPRRVADAMRAHPEVVGGTGRDVTLLMAALPGLLAKDGAEGVYAASLPDGTGIALKIDDGSGRARAPALLAALAALGAMDHVDPGRRAELAAVAAPAVLGGGRPVGAVVARPLPAL